MSIEKKHAKVSDAAALDKLSTLPELKRRQLLGFMLAAPAMGLTSMLAGCGGGGSDSGGTDTGATPGNSNSGSAGSSASSSSAASSAAPVSSFTFATLPDTQFYPRYASGYMGKLYQKRYGNINGQYDNPFKSQTQWIAANAARLKLAFTSHLGDVVDQPYYYASKYEASSPWTSSTDLVSGTQLSDGSVTKEWELASQAMQVLEVAKCPYSILAGNHDVGANGSSIQWGPDWGVDSSGFTNTDGYQDGGTFRTSYDQPYLHVFPTARAQQQSTFGGRHSSGFHEYHIFSAEGNMWLVLAMSWRASDDALSWANSIIAQNPTLPVILTCHQFAGIGSDGTTAAETAYSKYLWDKLIKNNDQIFMVISGHYHGSCSLVKQNAAGHDVFIMVVDYQMAYMGGNGLMRMYEFDLTNSRIVASSFSPWVPEKPAADLNEFDSAWLTAPAHAFTLSINFAKRFAAFNSAFTVTAGSTSDSLTDVAKQLILTNYTQPTQHVGTVASGVDDYPLVSGTAAHWRFYKAGAADSTQLTSGNVVKDISGNANDVTLMTWSGALSDLSWSTDHHYLSATPGSVQFKNSTKSHFNYFVTQTGMPVNTATFENGYTLEAFIYIDPAWTIANNSWMGIIYRLGARSKATDVAWTSGVDTGDTMMMMAISNLMEIQWEVVPTNATSNYACWSGGITAGQWLHIAIVNDPADGYATTMYVEGAPILRNNSGMDGIRTTGEKLTAIGAAQYGGSMNNGFIGKIGEIRIVPKPLAADQWLTARATKSASSSSTSV